ncbi:fucolectin-like [Elysia marginata]|uniref:Fucolectin-like n=1 Tax=Elysia marginata TaxID=1093978 RepID=A0AAV4G944_9GAST|nr:fucolectin-like [Elysia marginata]
MYASFHAVDGVHSTYQRNCARTTEGTGTLAWWMVDLRTVQLVHGVAILNRGHTLNEQLKNFTVDLFLEDPRVVVGFPEVSGMVCAHRSDEVGGKEWVGLDCNVSGPVAGRYVRVTKGGGQHLTLCEVQVYATFLIIKNTFRQYPGVKSLSEPQVDLGVFNSSTHCAFTLLNRPDLGAFSFNLPSGLCRGRVFDFGFAVTEHDEEWNDFERVVESSSSFSPTVQPIEIETQTAS